MEILATSLGKRFNFNWIFQDVQLHIKQGDRCVLLGSNGSGKSTLLQILSGAILPSSGTIQWKLAGNDLDSEEVYKQISLAAPYLELIEDFSLREHLSFHFSLKPMVKGISLDDLIQISTLKDTADRPIRYYSSGMKQRLRLLLAICSDTPLLLLDEPLSNLDEAGNNWYLKLISDFGVGRTILVASNHQAREYEFCNTRLSLSPSL